MRIICKKDRDVRGGLLPETVNKMRRYYKVGDTITRTVIDPADGEQYKVKLYVVAKYPHFLIVEGWGRHNGRKLSISLRYVDLCIEEIDRNRRGKDHRRK